MSTGKAQLFLIMDESHVLYECYRLDEAEALFHSDPNALTLISKRGEVLLSREIVSTLPEWTGEKPIE
jgi:hypothetical protein